MSDRTRSSWIATDRSRRSRSSSSASAANGASTSAPVPAASWGERARPEHVVGERERHALTAPRVARERGARRQGFGQRPRLDWSESIRSLLRVRLELADRVLEREKHRAVHADVADRVMIGAVALGRSP